jgi:hypothetical protein
MTSTTDLLLCSSEVRQHPDGSLQCNNSGEKICLNLARKALHVLLAVSEVTDAEP